MKLPVKFTITIQIEEDIEVPDGGSPAECDASAINSLIDSHRAGWVTDVKDFLGALGVSGSVEAQSEEA